MKKLILCSILFNFLIVNPKKLEANNDIYQLQFCDSVYTKNNNSQKSISKKDEVYFKRLQYLDSQTPMDLSYNEKVKPFIESYLNQNKKLISRMKGVSPYYFSIFEEALDRHGLPLELKYLPIVESALNPKAKSPSGATGLWQFMYLTGKQYDLNVTSYMDDRQDPIKSTEAACIYFSSLYETFGDWNLVLAAYNGGPGYIQRKIEKFGKKNFWDLHKDLRQETRNYIPTFIAVNYAMNYFEEHQIEIIQPGVLGDATDTIIIRKQTSNEVLGELLCVDQETLNYLNPAYKKNIYPAGYVITIPAYAKKDFLSNLESSYLFIEKVENKEILINEERLVHDVKEGDYLGRIAQEYGVRVFEIKEWNNLLTTKLKIGQKLILFVKKDASKENSNLISENEYVVQKGDTLWGIAKKFKGVTVWKIKSLNNLDNDNLKPGTKIVLPTI